MKKSMVQFTIIRAAAILALIALTACGSSPRSPGSSTGVSPGASGGATGGSAAAGSPAGVSPGASGNSASSERKVSGRIPQFARDALRNAPENALVAIGTAKMATINQSMVFAETRARAGISRQMDTMMKEMVRDFTEGSEVDLSAATAFQENLISALSKSRLKGSSVVDTDFDDNGNCWSVVMLSKSGAVQEINQAVSAAKLKVPKMASFDAEKRMDAAFAKEYGEEVPIVDKD